MHRAGVVVDIGGFSGWAGLFAPNSEQERKERESEEKKRSSGVPEYWRDGASGVPPPYVGSDGD